MINYTTEGYKICNNTTTTILSLVFLMEAKLTSGNNYIWNVSDVFAYNTSTILLSINMSTIWKRG